MSAAPELDFELVGKTAETAFGYLTGAITAGMIYVGEATGLYRAMAGQGPVTSHELAGKTGLSERWVREWLRGQAAAGLIDYRGTERFELGPERALVLADEETPASVVGAFSALPQQMLLLEKVPGSFRTGRGHTYDDGGLAVAVGIERMMGPWNKTALISEALPKLPGVVERLERGAKVADVGCGAGVADIAIAKAFPKSEVHGYDNSVHALARAEANRKESGLKNVFFHNIDSDPMPSDGRFDLVTCLDCLHDMARPDLAAAAIRKAIRPDGTWFIVDVDCNEAYEDNLSNPLAAMMYGFSVLICMSSSASTPDGLALGTVGLPEPKMRALAKTAGFSRFSRVEGLEHPFNAYYLAQV
jgi:2-polyprenyl-3-methyl-5-hydroxy-6-metoxy-1,4-benzoquinol methylase